MYDQTKKADAGKDRWDLLPMNQIQKVVKVLTDGAEKYGDNGWRDVDSPQDRFYAAMMRHIHAWRTGDKIDKESGFNHMIHVICNAIFLAEFDETLEDVDKVHETLTEYALKHSKKCMNCKYHVQYDENDPSLYTCLLKVNTYPYCACQNYEERK